MVVKYKGKKIDVFKNGKKIASVGAIGYNAYPTYKEKKGKKYADERRRLYKIRVSAEAFPSSDSLIAVVDCGAPVSTAAVTAVGETS